MFRHKQIYNTGRKKRLQLQRGAKPPKQQEDPEVQSTQGKGEERPPRTQRGTVTSYGHTTPNTRERRAGDKRLEYADEPF